MLAHFSAFVDLRRSHTRASTSRSALIPTWRRDHCQTVALPMLNGPSIADSDSPKLKQPLNGSVPLSHTTISYRPT